MSSLLRSSRRFVVKVGSSLVTNVGRGLDQQAISSWAEQISRLSCAGDDIVLVSSGAVAEGMKRLGWRKRPTALNQLQAAAAVGQMGLVQMYEMCFRQHDITAAQILLTHADLTDRQRYLNARSTLLTLLEMRAIPIINENDTVVTDEIRFGDNDTLAALVANLIEADALVILTDQPGLYTSDPRKDSQAVLMQQGVAGDERLEAMAGGVGTSLGRGGMMTKVLAAKRAARSGAHTIIVSGAEPDVLVRLRQGELLGTHLRATAKKTVARKQWLADHLRVSGQLTLDAGAVRALCHEGKSLLPVGVRAVSGAFDRGDLVSCFNQEGKEVARGLVNYAAPEVQRIMQRPSSEIEALLGYVDEAELIHRDNLVILA